MTTRRALLAAGGASLLAGCSSLDLANALTPDGDLDVRRGLPYGEGRRARYDLYLPPGLPARAPLLVFFYGGGWMSGERGDYGFVARPLCALGLAVAVPDYRLYPETRWPGFVEDGARAVAAASAGEGMAGRPVLLMGHSAGAFLAGALALDPRWLGRARRDTLAGFVGLAGPYAFGPEERDYAAIFADAPGGRARAAPEDPAALRGAPPLLLMQGLDDTVVRPAQATRLAEAARAEGVPATARLLPGVGHIGILAALAAPVRRLGLAGAPVLEEVGAWVRGSARLDADRLPVG